MRDIIFQNEAFQEFLDWTNVDKNKQSKIGKLINEIIRNPFAGIGKPEPLKSNMQGYWSRRIDNEHRLIYKVTESSIIIISCKYHYK